MQHTERVTAVTEREGDGYVALCPVAGRRLVWRHPATERANLEEALGLFFEAASPDEIFARFHREVYITHLDVAVP